MFLLSLSRTPKLVTIAECLQLCSSSSRYSSGAIQAALHLHMPEYQFDRLRMHVDAVNGQLPDIDLVRYENIYIYIYIKVVSLRRIRNSARTLSVSYV